MSFECDGFIIVCTISLYYCIQDQLLQTQSELSSLELCATVTTESEDNNKEKSSCPEDTRIWLRSSIDYTPPSRSNSRVLRTPMKKSRPKKSQPKKHQRSQVPILNINVKPQMRSMQEQRRKFLNGTPQCKIYYPLYPSHPTISGIPNNRMSVT